MKPNRTSIKRLLLDKDNFPVLGLISSLFLLAILLRIPEPGTFSGHYWRVELLVSGLLACIFGWAVIRRKIDYRSEGFLTGRLAQIIVIWLIFITWSGISSIWATHARLALLHTLTWGLYLVLLLFLLYFLKESRNIRPLITVFFLLSVILLVNASFDLITAMVVSGSVRIPRIRYSKYAELLVTFAPLLWILAVYWKKKEAFIFFTVAGAMAWTTVMLSMGKGAFVSGISGFLLCFVTVFFFSKKAFRKRVIVSASIWLLFTISFQAAFTATSSVPSTTNFISGAAEKKRETSSFRVFSWKVTGTMISNNPVIGVGANNFGIRFNDSRVQYAKTAPDDQGLALFPDHMTERAHNEYLQVFAELGVVGGLLFLSMLLMIPVWVLGSLRRNGYKLSPALIGSLSGVSAFLISSLFSSFSFRLVSNGVVFTMVLSILIYELLKTDRRPSDKPTEDRLRFFSFKPALAVGTGTIVLMLVFSSTIAVSDYYCYLGEREEDLDQALRYFERSLVFNSENASAYLARGARLYSEKRMGEASEDLQRAVDLGLGTVLSYSYLGTAYEKAGQIEQARATLQTNAETFPQTIFARVRYARFLEKIDKPELSAREMGNAESLDKKHARGWYNLIRFKSETAYFMSLEDDQAAPPIVLRPKRARIPYLEKKQMFEKTARK